MTRDDIYDHLARVYIGKKKETKKETRRQFNVWLFINLVITVIIFTSAFYGLTAFLTHQRPALKKNIIYSLYQGPIQISYNFQNGLVPVQTFSLDVSTVDVSKYQSINFLIRGREEGSPGIVKMVVTNARNEVSAVYVRGIDLSWRKHRLPLEEFREITDWRSVTNVSIVVEEWNAADKTGVVLIDDLRFSSS